MIIWIIYSIRMSMHNNDNIHVRYAYRSIKFMKAVPMHAHVGLSLVNILRHIIVGGHDLGRVCDHMIILVITSQKIIL